MDELKEFEMQMSTDIVAEPPMKGHYETVKKYTREDPVYDENGNPIGSKIVVIGREAKWVWDDPEEIKNELRNKRKPFLNAFDKWEKAVLRGREEDKRFIMEWYYDLLDLNKHAFENVPEEIKYYL